LLTGNSTTCGFLHAKALEMLSAGCGGSASPSRLYKMAEPSASGKKTVPWCLAPSLVIVCGQ